MALPLFGSAINSNTLFLTLPTPSPNNLIQNHRTKFMFNSSSLNYGHTLFYSYKRSYVPTILCSASNKPSNSSQISSTAKIRSEVLSPFRSVRMFFYIAFIGSASLGTLIATSQLIGALANPSREEILSNLKLRVSEKKIIPVSSLRGIARLVICAGPASFITEAFKRSKPYTESLIDRGVLVVPLVTDGNSPVLEVDETEETKQLATNRKRLWQLAPLYIVEWSEWLDEQKKMAGVSSESPVL